jgi:hypothetical protein
MVRPIGRACIEPSLNSLGEPICRPIKDRSSRFEPRVEGSFSMHSLSSAEEPESRISGSFVVAPTNASDPLHLAVGKLQDLVLRNFKERHDVPVNSEKGTASDAADATMAHGNGAHR